MNYNDLCNDVMSNIVNLKERCELHDYLNALMLLVIQENKLHKRNIDVKKLGALLKIFRCIDKRDNFMKKLYERVKNEKNLMCTSEYNNNLLRLCNKIVEKIKIVDSTILRNS